MDDCAQYYQDIVELLAKQDEKLNEILDDLSELKEGQDSLREEFFNSPKEDD